MNTALKWAEEWPGAEFRPGDVHVGRLLIERADPALENHLTSGELDRASSFHFEVDRVRYVSSRGALRALLARYLDVEPRSIEIVIDPGGKPRLSEGTHHHEVQFNVSHSNSLVMIGITRGVPIGVDVEEITGDIPHRAMAARFFSPKELGEFDAVPVEEQVAHFFDVWTRKEAYLKGIGEGLSMPPASFSVSVAGPGATPVDDPSHPERWWTAAVDIADGFHAALALPRREWTVKPFEIVPSQG